MKRMVASGLLAAIACVAQAWPLMGQDSLDQKIDANIQDWVGTYQHLHQYPELSTQEKETSTYIASSLKRMGYSMTDHFGKYEDPNLTSYGVVAVLKNGPGPTIYVRTELDALPVKEKTGVPYASQVTVKRNGGDVGVMHACGHDLHMTVFLGTAKVLAESRGQWTGTVVMLGQPAEETVGGAQAMLREGLFSKFPKPDYVLALHDNSTLPAGKVAWKEGTMLAGADSVDITVRGYGGHGAAPHATKDPILIASEIVVMLQTIVSREMNPLQPTVITVGSFHAGTKHNIIPDDAHLQLTVRTMTPEQRTKTLEAIKRVTNGVASAAGVPADLMPVVEYSKDNVPATLNDSALTKRVAAALDNALGKENVLPADPVMASEDFSLFALADPKPPTMMFWLGAVDPQKIQDAKEKGTRLPGLHSSEFAPDAEPAIRTGVKAMTTAVEALLPKQ
ncbi:MAG TPA: amidohydrolase [Candidatus Saccharimonadales bacterium]|nr:amidohydrolase [Candidatus Saccharimonadales bacterium]